MNWDNYDNWRLSSPYDNDNTPEVFVTQLFDMYSCNEDDVTEFDDLVNKAKKDVNVYLGDRTNDMFSLSDYVEMLLDDEFFGRLHDSSYEAMSSFEENYHDEKEYAMEQKAQQIKDDKLTEDM